MLNLPRECNANEQNLLFELISMIRHMKSLTFETGLIDILHCLHSLFDFAHKH